MQKTHVRGQVLSGNNRKLLSQYHTSGLPEVMDGFEPEALILIDWDDATGAGDFADVFRHLIGGDTGWGGWEVDFNKGNPSTANNRRISSL